MISWMDERPRGQRRIRLLVTALVGALVTTGLVTVVSAFISSADGTYGAPIAVGRSCFDVPLPDPRCGIDFTSGHPTVVTTFSWLLFAGDVLVNWILWFALARWSGLVGVAVGVIGALVSILLIPVMLSYQLQIVGLPIPLGSRTPVPNALAIWLDVLAWAAAAAGLSRIIRTRWIARTT